ALVQRDLLAPDADMNQAGARVAKDLGGNWDALLLHYVGLTLLVALGVLLAVITPIAGLVFACCRCGGRCGGDYPTYDKKRDPCKRAALGTLLATLVVVVLLGLVCSFVTNARMEDGVENLPNELQVSIQDTKLFFNNTHKEIKTLYEDNFKELQNVLFNKLDRSGELIKMKLARVSKAIAIDNLTAIASSLTNIKNDLHIIRNTTIELQEETSYLQSGLRDVAGRLKKLKKACENIPQCLLLIEKYASKLEISNDFNKLPSVKDNLREVTDLINNDIEIEVKRGKRAFDSIARDIQSKVQNSIPEIKQQIKRYGQVLRRVSRDLKKNFQKLELDNASDNVETLRHYINEYSMYRYWYFFLICVLLLIITLCFTMGVVFGCCGRRPDEASSCYKTTGASWLMWGVGLTFLFSIVIMLTTSALFLVGSLGELLMCDPLRDPSNSEVLDMLSQNINLEKYFIKGQTRPLPDIIRSCHQNESLYIVLELHHYDPLIENMTNYRDSLKLEDKIENIKNKIGESIDTNVQILSKEAKQQLNNLSNSTIARRDSWDYYTNILEQEVLKIDLLVLAAQLNQTADALPPDYGSVAVKLKNDAIFVEGLRRWLTSIKTNIKILKETMDRLNEALKFNKTSLNVAIQDLMKQAEFAQKYLQTNGSAEVAELVNRFTDDFLADVDHYVEYIKMNMIECVGRCGPMSAVYNSTASAICRKILYPFNGYWASVGWCFLFFIPCMVVAVQLASLYRKTEPYSGQLTESGCDKKQRRRSRDYECGRVAGSYASEPYSAPPHSSPPRADYPPPNNDWGEYPPTGGPPRYTSQPSLSPEYERPPPYYYPGPGAQYYGGPQSQSGPSTGCGPQAPPSDHSVFVTFQVQPVRPSTLHATLHATPQVAPHVAPHAAPHATPLATLLATPHATSPPVPQRLRVVLWFEEMLKNAVLLLLFLSSVLLQSPQILRSSI
ncbi:Prominin-1-A, partial [Armadillidium nasatum]